MTRWLRRLGNEVGLGAIERSYLSESYWFSAGIPKRRRKQFATELAEQLSERPPSANRDELEEALGAPASVGRAFNQEHGFSSPMAPWSRWWASPRWLRSTEVGVIVALAIAGVLGYQYFTATPVFWNYCGGVAATDVESFEAAGATEYRAAFRQDERLGLYVCVGSSTPGAVVERIRAPLAPRSIIQPVGVETDLDASDARAIFQVEDRVLAELLIDGAVLGVCPDFADRRDELVAMLL